MDVYHALSFANNSLANIYYKPSRGVPLQELQKDQLASMRCATESRFALMKTSYFVEILQRFEAHRGAASA